MFCLPFFFVKDIPIPPFEKNLLLLLFSYSLLQLNSVSFFFWLNSVWIDLVSFLILSGLEVIDPTPEVKGISPINTCQYVGQAIYGYFTGFGLAGVWPLASCAHGQLLGLLPPASGSASLENTWRFASIVDVVLRFFGSSGCCWFFHRCTPF